MRFAFFFFYIIYSCPLVSRIGQYPLYHCSTHTNNHNLIYFNSFFLALFIPHSLSSSPVSPQVSHECNLTPCAALSRQMRLPVDPRGKLALIRSFGSVSPLLSPSLFYNPNNYVISWCETSPPFPSLSAPIMSYRRQFSVFQRAWHMKRGSRVAFDGISSVLHECVFSSESDSSQHDIPCVFYIYVPYCVRHSMVEFFRREGFAKLD